MTNKGYIFIVDITGYTAYLSKSELTHAQEILESLMNTLVEHIHPPIVISRIEGDGVFAYTFEDCFLQSQTMLESLEHLYSAFAFELEHMKRNTTCTCTACALMPDLDLKIIVHHGEFGVQTIGDRTDIVGTDVNLTHRLAKNSIQEKTDVEAYVYFTKEAIEASRMQEYADSAMIAHNESYDHIGEIDGYVYDLQPVWERERERRRVIVTSEEAGLDGSFELPVSPAIAWDYLTDPAVRQIYLDADKMGTSKIDGRMMIGSQFHCAHGDNLIDQLILDWQPFDYFTFDAAMNVTKKMKACIRISVMLEEMEGGTKVRMMWAKPTAVNPLAQVMAGKLWKDFEKNFDQSIDFQKQMILEAIEEKANPEAPLIKMPSEKTAHAHAQ